MRSLPLTIVLLAGAAYAADPAVAVSGGSVRGGLLQPGGAVFKGIHFAQPPLGDLRWRPPQPVKPWTSVRDAAAFGPPCAQNSDGRILAVSQEDCLYLNLWSPEWPPQSPKPVMFWIHGGGNYGGTASGANFDGESLALHGVVVVT